MDTAYAYPKLRPVEAKYIVHEGQPFLLLRDFMLGDESAVLLRWDLRGLAIACDGRHDLDGLRVACLALGGPALTRDEVGALVETLARAGLLEGPLADAAQARALETYRSAPHRPLSHADAVYPADPDEARSLLATYEEQAACASLPAECVAGVLSPHIDYRRGGRVYAAGWSQAAAAARAARLAIVLGTDHKGGPGRITLTRQRYATPWGMLPLAEELVDRLAKVLGEERAFAEELRHRDEHSIELATVWLHHVRGGEPLALLPVLCGYHAPWVERGLPGDDAALAEALAVLRETVAEGAFVVVAGDLAHVGPEFGDHFAMGAVERAIVRAADDALIAACARGAEALLQTAGPVDERFRVCGLSPLALALAILPPVRLEVAAYDQCPADARNASFVSVAAGAFVRA